MSSITALWNTLFFEPMLNGLVLLYGLLFENFGITIIVFTILVRIVMLPLTLKQLHATKAMSALQPKMAALQKRYGKDRQRLSQEQMKMYREQGVNPLGCAIPTFIQFPIWIGLYQSILLAMAATPESLVSLSERIYTGLPQITGMIPLKSSFLWMDLAQPDRSGVLTVLVFASTYVQQKMMTMPTTDPKQQQMNSMMLWMMPLMLGFFAMQFASGLAIYWVISNIATMVIQYFVSGWGGLFPSSQKAATEGSADQPAETSEDSEEALAVEKRQSDGRSGNKRKNSRRGHRAGAREARRR